MIKTGVAGTCLLGICDCDNDDKSNGKSDDANGGEKETNSE